MISIIICSRKTDISQELKDNIAATIGCEYELCNSRNEYNIFTAYNEGVCRAKGEVLCFMHEDVLFHSECWGGIVNDYFADCKDAGLLGVIGGQFIPDTPSSYWEGGTQVGAVIQGYKDEKGCYQTYIEGSKPKELYSEVVAVDGLFICIPKNLFDLKVLAWDSETFHGFHCYDMDICYQVVNNGKKVMIARDILIEHQSPGNTDSVYCEQSQLLYNKWRNFLPIIKGREMTEQEIDERTKMVACIRSNLLLYNKVQKQYEQIRSSKAYRFGKVILHPSLANIQSLFRISK